MVRLVLIDDHNLFREGLKAIFQIRPDLSVVGEAESAAGGLEAVERVACDLVLADFSLPDHEAPWLVTRLRQLRPQLPVLVLSQNTDYERVRQVLSVGASGYLVKTAHSQELLQAISLVAGGGVYLHPAVARALTAQPSDGLSERERAILQMLVAGRSNPAIADTLHVSLGTVKADLQSLFQKLGVKDRTHLAAVALARGLVRPPDD